MKRSANGTPLWIKNNTTEVLRQQPAKDEASIQELIFQYPQCLPLGEIDETYNPSIPVCTELNTPVGPLDIFMITTNGNLAIIETKLWRNPEARRTVVAQILDYATELSKWSYEDLQREVNRRLQRTGNTLYEIARSAAPDQVPEEMDFVDAVSRNLKRGNFLLLVAGDGIREGAHGISEFLANTGHFNFTFAMVELSVYGNPEEGMLLVPRTIVQTVEIQKLTVEVPPEMSVSSAEAPVDTEANPEWEAEKQFYNTFWKELITELVLDDPGQAHPKPSKSQNIYIYPAQSTYAWISAYFSKSSKQVGVYFRCRNEENGNAIFQSLSNDAEAIREEFGDRVKWAWDVSAGPSISLTCDDIFATENRDALKAFFNEWLNTFVNVFRPRMKNL